MGKYGRPKSAGLFAVIAAVLAFIVIYTAFAPVDIVFRHGDEEVYRQENACALSFYDNPFENIDDGEALEEDGMAFFYTDRGVKQLYSKNSFRLRLRVAKTSLKCLITFKLDEADRVIICDSYYK